MNVHATSRSSVAHRRVGLLGTIVAYLLAPAVARADTYTVNLIVPSQAPIAPFGHEPKAWVTMRFVKDVAPGQPDVVIPSTYPFVRCALEDGDLFVKFSAPAATYPKAADLPATATCEAGGHKLVIHLSMHNTPVVPDPTFTLDPVLGGGFSVAPGIHVVQSYLLEGTWLNGRVVGETPLLHGNGVPWPKVSCFTFLEGDGSPWVGIHVAGASASGTGYCPLVDKATGAPLPLPFELVVQ